MKRYRLIRRRNPEDPFSLGTIAEICTGGYTTILDVDGKGKNLENYGFKWIIEYPEFWEEIIEYPIGTKVLNSHTDTIYTKKEDGWYKPLEKTSYTDEMIRNAKNITVIDEKVVEKEYEILSIMPINELNFNGIIFAYNCNDLLNYLIKGNYKILSIKRLIDGKIFTVGDKVKYNGNPPNPIREIKNFYIKDERLLFNWIDDKYQSGYCFNLLNKYDHLKQPLFTTEDGIDIYKGDKFWFVNNIYNGHYNLCTATAGKNKVESTKVEGILDFSTKEAAEEYILMNKPCLSLKEVLNTVSFLERSIEKLKELVKSKL